MKVFLFCIFQVFIVFGKQLHLRNIPIKIKLEKHGGRSITRRAINHPPGFDLDEFRKDQLYVHNYFRKLHGVQKLELDETLNSEAQRYAEYLAANNVIQHCHQKGCNPSNAGENIAFSFGASSVATNATLRWYEEVLDYNYCSFPYGRATTRPGHHGKTVRHFTQVVWASTMHLGIGYARSLQNNKVYVVGRYLPPGNIIANYHHNVPKANYLTNIFQDDCRGTNGSFASWSRPTACSKLCGGGIRLQYRTCTDPKPSLNGKDCVGKTKKVYPYWCNLQECPTKGTERERDRQCRKRGYIPKSYHFWGRWECTLYCLAYQDRAFFKERGIVDDGTRCKGSTGTCIDGICIILKKPSVIIPATQPPVTLGPIWTNPPVTFPPVVTLPITTKQPTVPTLPRAIDGGWSRWSDGGPCSKSCGAGIRYQNRTCTNPVPSHGGRPCTGPRIKLSKVWCNPQPCSPSFDTRNQQCKMKGFRPDAHNFKGPDDCLLHCRDTQTGYYYERGHVLNGTHCNVHAGACLGNKCVPMVYETGTLIKGIYKRIPSANYWNNIFLEVPNGATDLVITNHRPIVEAVVGYRSSYSYGYTYAENVRGVKVQYNATHVTIKGPVKPNSGYEIVVYALGRHQAHIEYQYKP